VVVNLKGLNLLKEPCMHDVNT